MHNALHPKDEVDYMYQEKKEEEENSVALKIRCTHHNEKSLTTLKSAKKDNSLDILSD